MNNIQSIDLLEIESLSSTISQFVNEIKNQSSLDPNQIFSTISEYIPIHHNENLQKLFSTYQRNEKVIIYLSDLLFSCFKTIEDLCDRNTQLKEVNEKMMEELEEVNRLNSHLLENEGTLRERASQKIENLSVILTDLTGEKKNLEEKIQQIEAYQNLKEEEEIKKEKEICQWYENQMLKKDQNIYFLQTEIQKLQDDVLHLQNSLKQISPKQEQTILNQDLALPLKENQHFAFSSVQIEDLQYEQDLTSRSVVQRSQSLLLDIGNEKNEKQQLLSTEESIESPSYKKALNREKGFSHTLCHKQMGEKGRKMVGNFEKEKSSAFKKIHTFLHSNIVKRKLKIKA